MCVGSKIRHVWQENVKVKIITGKKRPALYYILENVYQLLIEALENFVAEDGYMLH